MIGLRFDHNLNSLIDDINLIPNDISQIIQEGSWLLPSYQPV